MTNRIRFCEFMAGRPSRLPVEFPRRCDRANKPDHAHLLQTMRGRIDSISSGRIVSNSKMGTRSARVEVNQAQNSKPSCMRIEPGECAKKSAANKAKKLTVNRLQ